MRVAQAGLALLCVVLACHSVEGTNAPQEGDATVHHIEGDHPSFMEIGEGAPSQHAVERVANAVDPTKQSTLKVIEKLMEAPIIDPRQEKSYKAAATTVEHVKKAIANDLAKVVQMEILSQRVSELDAKKAMGIEGDVNHWLNEGEAAMTGAISSGGEGCADSHPGLCAGVQVQGHCGISDYAKACPLSCHRCAMPPTFRLKNSHEAAQKSMEEKSGKAAVLAEKKLEKQKLGKANEIYNKAQTKYEAAKSKATALHRRIAKLDNALSSGQESNERDVKSANEDVERAKAAVKAAKENVGKKKKLKIVKRKADKTPIKSTKTVLKDLEAQAKRRDKELKKEIKKEKKDSKTLKKLADDKAKAEGAMAEVRAQKKELFEKRTLSLKAKATADSMVKIQREKIELAAKTEQKESRSSEIIMVRQTKGLKKRMHQVLKREAKARSKRERLELVSKAEEKRLQMFTVPGAERKVKSELMKTDRDVHDAKRKMDRYQVKFGHLGVKIKIPAQLEHAYAVAKKAKLSVEGLIKKLDAEQQSPAAQKLKASEIEAKGEFKKEEEEVIRLKKMLKGEKKDVKKFEDSDKKRRKDAAESQKKEDGIAKKVEDGATKQYKKDIEGIKKSEAKLLKDEGKAAKDMISPSQVLDATEIVNRDQNKIKDIRRSVKSSHATILKTKNKLGKVKSEVERQKMEAKMLYARDKQQKAMEIADVQMKAEKNKGEAKAAAAKLKSAKFKITQVMKMKKKLDSAEKSYDKELTKESVAESAKRLAKQALEAVKRGEPAELADAKKQGVADADKKIVKKEEGKKAKKKVAAAKKQAAALSASTKAMLTVAKAAMQAQEDAAKAENMTSPPNDEKCTGSEDMHPKLCSIIQNHKHCGYGNYKDYCCGSCAGTKREMGDGGEISKLEAQLGHSIAKADTAIQHAHSTEVDSKESLSGGSQ